MHIKSKQLMHELADKCKSQYVNHNGPWMDYILFAELIVKECASLQHRNIVVGGTSEYNRGRRELADDIKQHFGIEE